MPFVRNLVNALQATADGVYFLLSKDSKVPMSKFIVYKKLYEQTGKALEDVIRDERKTVEAFNSQKVELENARIQANQARDKSHDFTEANSSLKSLFDATKKELEKFKSDFTTLTLQEAVLRQHVNNLKDITFLTGSWEFELKDKLIRKPIKLKLQIRNGEVYSNGQFQYSIEEFFWDSHRGKLFMTLKQKNQEDNTLIDNEGLLTSSQLIDRFDALRRIRKTNDYGVETVIHTLAVINENKLVGTENYLSDITYKRVSPREFNEQSTIATIAS